MAQGGAPLPSRFLRLALWAALAFALAALVRRSRPRLVSKPGAGEAPPRLVYERTVRPSPLLLVAASVICTLVLTQSSAPVAGHVLRSEEAQREPLLSTINGLDGLGALSLRRAPPPDDGSNRPPFVWPVEGAWITTLFSGGHAGVDLGSEEGRPVVAARDGVVSMAAGDVCCGLGLFVQIGHDEGWSTVYGHLSDYAVKVGDGVKQGQLIGVVGNTGHSTGPHVHLELRLQGIAVDPMAYFPEGIEIRLEPDPTATPSDTPEPTDTPHPTQTPATQQEEPTPLPPTATLPPPAPTPTLPPPTPAGGAAGWARSH